MGVPVNDCRAGTLVWVQRKNGSWWPGRVLDPNEISLSKQPGAPVKLLGKEDASVEWYDLEKSKRVKAFRCGEFDDCIGKAESSQASYSSKIVKYAHRVVAILQALELEKLEAKRKRKGSGVCISSSGEERAGIICRGKRSRRVFVLDESNYCWKRATMNTESPQAPSTLKMHKYPLLFNVAEDDTSSRSAGPDSSENGSVSRLQMRTQLSDTARVAVNGSRYFGKHYVRSVNFYRKGKEPNDFSSSPPDHPTKTVPKSQNCEPMLLDGKNRVKLNNGSHRNEELQTSTPPPNGHSRTVFYTKERSNTAATARTSSYLEKPRMETTLVDVELTVKIQCGREHVPLVSLMSKTNGQAIVGHPIDIEELDDGSSDALVADKHGITARAPFDNGTRAMLPPTWKRCKRTPVCYVPQASPSSKNIKEASVQSSGQEKLKSSFTREEFTTKPLKKRPLPVLGNEGDLQPTAVKGSNGVPNRAACVPLKLVFEKLLMAVCKA